MSDHVAAVAEVFEAFEGSAAKLAGEIGAPVQTVFDWKSGDIPPWRRPAVLDAINRLGKKVSASTLAYLASTKRAPRTEPAQAAA